VDSYIKTFSSLPTDFLIIGGLFALILFLSLKQGRSYLAAAIISLYIASFLYEYLPFTKTLVSTIKGSSNLFWIHTATFLIFYIASYFIISKVSMSDYGRSKSRLFKACLLTAAFVGLLISVFYHIIPLESVYNFSPAIDKIFASNIAYNFWLIAPLAVLFF
jgi:hypothetical protein